VKQERIHGGAINMLAVTDDGLIVTGSADRKIKFFDLTAGLKCVGEQNCTDAIFCGKVVGDLALAGCGDGNLLAFDCKTSECLYGYGADEVGAVHCMEMTHDRSALITGGDSG